MLLLSATLLAATAVGGASASSAVAAADNNNNNLRALQLGLPPASIACITAGKTFLECCPTSDPNDGVCTLLWCVDLDNVAIRTNCNCAELETSCNQVGMFAALVPNLLEMCTAVDDCCIDDDNMVTENDDWNTCMDDKLESSDFTPPNFAMLIPGGVPEIPEEGPPKVEDTTTEATSTFTTTEVTTDAPEVGPTTTTESPPETTEMMDTTTEATEMAKIDPTTTTEVPPPTTDETAEMATTDATTTEGPPAATTVTPAEIEPDTTVFPGMPEMPVMPGLPPASVACMAAGKDVLECCPSIDPADGICTLLWCYDLENIAVRDDFDCTCSQIETSCGQVGMFGALVPNLSGMCDGVSTCCESGAADNTKFNDCMAAAIADGEFDVPALGDMLGGLGGGGLPNFDEIEPAPLVSTTTTSSTSAASPSGSDGEDGTVAETTEPDDSGASGDVAGVLTALALVGSSLAMVIV